MEEHSEDPGLIIGDAVARLNNDLRQAAQKLEDNEVRFLVDLYYSEQATRIRLKNQMRALEKSGEPGLVVSWSFAQAQVLENQIKAALKRWADNEPRGEWMMSVPGIGPVLTAGMLSHIDITKCPTVGHLWSFAGYDPSRKWEKGQKRPWNATLKTIMWNAGQCFIKLQNHPRDYYGKTYAGWKHLEWLKNVEGAFAEQALEKLENFNFSRDTDAKIWYEGRLTAQDGLDYVKLGPTRPIDFAKKRAGEPGSGVRMLPPGRIDLRAQRRTMKLFMSHLHDVLYRLEFDKAPPEPYALAIKGHAHMIPVPDFTDEPEWVSTIDDRRGTVLVERK